MLPVGSRVKVIYPDNSASFGAWTHMNEEGFTAPADEFMTEAHVNSFTLVKLDNGASGYFYDRELQVISNPASASVMNGTVTIGDTVAWPQRASSSLWMVIGKITDIDHVIAGVTPVGKPVYVGDGSISVGFRATQSETKITIITPDGTKKSTKSLDRVVKACPITT